MEHLLTFRPALIADAIRSYTRHSGQANRKVSAIRNPWWTNHQTLDSRFRGNDGHLVGADLIRDWDCYVSLKTREIWSAVKPRCCKKRICRARSL
jgi:hypothetical protein